jgi:tRNA1Val (adenine37-N6)-methyltransferase
MAERVPDTTAPETTLDMLFDGRLRVLQPRRGYRFSIDAVLLAHQVRLPSEATVLDLGTGCGIVPLILCHRYPWISVWAVEIQAPLAELAARNARQNRMQRQISVRHADLRDLRKVDLPGMFDVVVANPPYRRPDSGRLNPGGQRAVARHELEAGLEDFLLCARQRLGDGGRFVVIYAAERLAEMMSAMQSSGIEPKCLRMVHTRRHFDAKRVLVEGVKGAKSGIRVAPPLVIHEYGDQYSDDVQAMFHP